MNNLQFGFYWVRWNHEVTIGRYVEGDDGNYWTVIGDEQGWSNGDIEVISPHPLVPPSTDENWR